MTETILVAGAGLVGSLLSIYLARMGHQVHIFDRYPDFREAEAPAGKSINLTLCERGFTALDRVGVGNRVRAIAVPCYGRVVHSADGELEYQPYGTRREAIHSVSRNHLNRVLLGVALEEPSLHCHFKLKCLEVDLHQPSLTLRDLRSGEMVDFRGDRLFGADGAHSAVRTQMQRTRRFDFTQEYLDQAYKELSVAPAADGGWAFEGNAIHIWPRGNYMLIGFPNLDHSFTLSLHMPYEGGKPSFSTVRTEEDLLELFTTSFPDALPLLPNLTADFFGRPEASMITVRCSPWTFEDKVVLIGDAAHAIVPSYGQGANSGFEDCSALSDCIVASNGDWHQAFACFESQRKPNADAIGDLALAHFKELRDLVGDREFQFRKTVERRLNELYPDRYIPLYNLISFTNVSYVEALQRDRVQRALLDRLMASPNLHLRERLERGDAEESLDPVLSDLTIEAFGQPVTS
ncbi:MAG: kynurenine 3-monooxygenase [Acidobacteriota bacterium]|jgi:kynurenine 3-monooxygenase|nr:kynurenine 3-monooxygenase [Acidobacteriota bacterium]